jgi:hypothetical protein
MADRMLVDAGPSAGSWAGGGESDLSPESWRGIGLRLASSRGRLEGSASRQMWEIGDWLRVGENRVFSNLNRIKVRALASELTGYSRHTLTMAVSVARKVDASIRVDGLSWWHHLAVANRSPDEQAEWLTRAAEEGWSVATLRVELRARGEAGRPSRPPSPERTARLIHDVLQLRRDAVPDGLVVELRRWLR